MRDKILIIGGGSSAAKLKPHTKAIREFFDHIIIVGGMFQLYDDIADQHLVTEKHLTELDILNKGDYRIDLQRQVNYKSIDRYNPKYNVIGITRSQRTADFSPDDYITNPWPPALLTGGIGSDGTALGSVLLQAIHLAAILKPSRIYLIGAELSFTDPHRDHAYDDGRYYRTAKSSHPNAAKYEVRDGIESTGYFFESAPVIDEFIRTDFKHIVFYNFSGGLLKEPVAVDFDKWVKTITHPVSS